MPSKKLLNDLMTSLDLTAGAGVWKQDGTVVLHQMAVSAHAANLTNLTSSHIVLTSIEFFNGNTTVFYFQLSDLNSLIS